MKSFDINSSKKLKYKHKRSVKTDKGVESKHPIKHRLKYRGQSTESSNSTRHFSKQSTKKRSLPVPKILRIKRLIPTNINSKLKRKKRLAIFSTKRARAFYIFSALVMVYSIAGDFIRPFLNNPRYNISPQAETLLPPRVDYYSPLLVTDPITRDIKYNETYTPGGNLGGDTARPKFSAVINSDSSEGISLNDPVNNVWISFKPLFDLGNPRQDVNRIVYPLLDGTKGTKIVSLGTSGYKEDIILDKYVAETLSFSYEISLPDGVEARLDSDGSVGFYGVNTALLGDVAATSEDDQELLENARLNGEKNTLLFRAPAPVVLEDSRTPSQASAWFTLENNVLTLHSDKLDKANYPISIDPSIYVETARQLMRGNNETNIDFDVDNELIKKGFTTGARFDTWNNTTDLNQGVWNHGTAVAGGYIYAVGGERASISTWTRSTSGSHTFPVPSGVTEITVKVWGAGGGGAGGGSSTAGAAGGGGGFAQATISTTPLENLDVYVGEGGNLGRGGATTGYNAGEGGGGGGRTYVERSGTPLIIGAGGGGGGGGDNSGGASAAGGGGAGGGATGSNGSSSGSAGGGNAGGTSCSGALCDGGSGGGNSGSDGASEAGGDGADGQASEGSDGGAANGGGPNAGDGGGIPGNSYGAGGGGGDGYFGGGGGSGAVAFNSSGAGGGGGSGYTTGTSTSNIGGSGSVPGNDTDSDRGGAGDGGTGGSNSGNGQDGTDGDDGIIVITYSTASANISQAQTPVTAQCNDSDSDCTASATITAATAGNHLIAVCSGEQSGGTWSNIVMNGYTSAIAETTNNNSGQEIFYKVSLGGETTVDCQVRGVGSTSIKGYLTVFEYSGLTGAPVDTTSSSTGNSSSPSTGTTGTTSQPDILLIAGTHSEQASVSFSSWTNSFTEQTDHSQADPSGSGHATAARTVTSTGTYSTGNTASSSNQWIGQLVAFKADTLGSGSEARKEVFWAELSTSDNSIDSPNPGAGPCTDWCTNGAYDLPEERIGFSLVAYNGFLYVIGGEDNSGNKENTVYIAKLGANGEPSLWHPTDSNQDNWVYWYSSSNNLTNATSYGAAAAYNGRMYFAGGDISSGDVSTVYMANLDPTGDIDAWTTTGITALPSDRHMHTLHTYNDYIYLVGGNSNGTLQNTVHYTNINSDDGTLGTWTATNSFTTARSTWGGNFATIWGGYLYLMGGCSAVDAGGECTTISLDVQLASINADGSLDVFNNVLNVANERIGFGLVAWDNALYRIGGCSNQDAGTAECLVVTNDEDYAVINTDGDASTVNISTGFGSGDCSGATPSNCDLPSPGDDAGEVGHMLNNVAVINGYLYVIGGCSEYECDDAENQPTSQGVSGNTAYVAIQPDGSLQRPEVCNGTYSQSGNGSWCVDATHRINGTTGVAAGSTVVFNNTIYVVGGLNGNGNTNSIYRNTVNEDGSLAGDWQSQTLTGVGATSVAYTYAYARANPSSAGTNPGNLFIFGGCSTTGDAACSAYSTAVYKCNILTSGAISGCSTSGQEQIDSDPDQGGSQGLGIHSGTVYANRVYLIGGYSSTEQDKDEVMIAEIDDSNNVVALPSESTWIESPNRLNTGRRRGWAFGYNGYIYSVGGFEDGGDTIIPDIEFTKVNVSDGSIDPFSVSAVTVNQRWGLAMAVSNSFAYVIGGCNEGNSPNDCSSFEDAVQTFQLYNNNSGSATGFSASSNQFGTDRYGTSSVVHNGYIYLAGGCTDADTTTDCSTTTTDVQYASIDALGEIGTWSSTTATLPAGRGWGQLEEAGGSLYYIGGEGADGDEKSEVFYSTPLSATGSAQDVFRSTTYEIENSEFTGSTYILNLNNDLSPDYFVMISGSDDRTVDNEPDDSSVRVSQDPHDNFSTNTADLDQIQLTRNGSTNDWQGTITVVECLVDCTDNGFKLKEVRHISMGVGTANTLQQVTDTLSEDHTSRTVPFGARYGGGMTSDNTDEDDYSVELGVRIQKTGSDQLTLERYGASGRVPEAVDVEVYIVEWGSSWTVQEANFNDWTNGGPAANADCDAGTPEYTCATITSVTVDDTWLWKSPGTSEDDGLGDGAFGKVITLGRGGSTDPSGTTTSVAIGAEHATDQRRDTVYVMEHNDLTADYINIADNSSGTSETVTIAGPVGTESYDNSSTDVRYTEGYRIPWILGTESGTGNAYARAGGWFPRITANTTMTYQKLYSGNNHVGWAQIADFNGITVTAGAGDIDSWTKASNGLGADRTQFGAASWNDRLYVVGGLDDSGNETNTVYISPDLSSGGDITSAWSTDTDTPDIARSGNVVVAYANNLYTFGGHDGSNYLLDSQFTQINTDGTVDAWTFTEPLPDAVRQGDGFAANGYVYVVGGRSSDTVCDTNTYVAPISANTTIATGNDPTGVGAWFETNERYSGNRFGNAVAYNEGRMYVLGGICSPGFPDVESVTETLFTSNTTSHNVSMPATVEAGDLLLAFFSNNGGDTVTNPSGWTEVGTISDAGDVRGGLYAKDAVGDEDGTTVDFVTSGSEEASALVYRILAEDWSGSLPNDVDADTDTDGTTSAPNSDSLNPSGWGTEDTLWFSFAAGNSYNSVDEYPTGYTGAQHANTGTGSGDSSISVSYAQINAASEDPDAYDMSDAEPSVILTAAVRPATTSLLTGSDRTSQTTLLSQPQLAKYSRLIDTDTDVFPNSYLLNGIDNSIGARWQVRYRSMHDNTDAEVNPNEDCGTSATMPVMSSFGQETDDGDTTLGDVNGYTPLNDSGGDINCARFFYFFIEISAEQTFGYPEDIDRGPTLTDLSLFFTADPSKRLRHGKTFTGGEQQPLDTPCRQSVDSDCPLP